MDWATPAGMLVAIAALVTSIILDGGEVSQLWNTSAFILVVGGTIGFTMTTFPLKSFAQLPRAIARAFRPPDEDRRALIQDMVKMAEIARKDGVLALQERLPAIAHPLLRRGLGMAIDGNDPQKVRESLLEEMELERHRVEEMAAILEQAGGYAPTVGIIGTVMGLVHVLGNLSEAEKLGPAIAVAFMATFYGIFTANLFWLPLGAKVKAQAQRAVETGQMILVGVAGIHTGENPGALREKLEVFLVDHARDKAAPSGTSGSPARGRKGARAGAPGAAKAAAAAKGD
ncbi:motility protein A [Caldinitratiruptor microaerophilus]|uniref:Flagellar motor protein MotA n=1 Tax=Caldinitratiruptor microaerophilus TaxID=671077 RepID=A0AA35G9N8_9FIRM|nr:MotA/TolQ/ExbB proton channel family protein [Caldinitratiruptor microaerophilus]BDG60484.1 flagellar motor protein MotA [Caldinitratiruptor microaerophilus]